MLTHIGKILQEKVNETGQPSVKDFASLVGLSPRTLYNIFNGVSEMTLPQIIKASEILSVDLISEYLKANDKLNVLHEGAVDYKAKKKLVTVSVHLCGDMDAMSNFPEMLNEINSMAARHGFKVS